ncbi:MAG: hypothetical protein ABSF90_22695 [Syntrophobacteraceae bacterium]
MTQGAIHERQGAGGCLYGSEWVNQDTAAIALDYAHVRQVIAANLIDTVGNFEEAVIVVKLGLAPQAWIHTWRGNAFYEVVGRPVPHFLPGGALSDQGVVRSDEPAARVFEPRHIVQGQLSADCRIGPGGYVGSLDMPVEIRIRTEVLRFPTLFSAAWRQQGAHDPGPD